jgi:hypothetical protein
MVRQLVLLALACLLATSADAFADSKRSVDLSGSWVLQLDLSSPATSPVLRGGIGARRGIGGAGMTAPGGAPTSSTPRHTDEEMARMRERVRQIVDPGPTLTIAHGRDAIVFTHGETVGQTFIPDGEKRTVKTTLGDIESKARWAGDKLVVEGKLRDGLKTTRTWQLDTTAQRRTLVMTVRVDGGKLPAPVEGRYVYLETGVAVMRERRAGVA